MKKNYFYYLTLLAIPLIALTLLSLSGGRDGQYSGSPGDGFANCTVCHSTGADFSALATITTTVPSGGYSAGSTYDITVSASSESLKHGFQLTAEDAANIKVGSFTAGTGNQVVNGGTHVTHTGAGNQQTSWTFEWTAPATAEGNEVTFYAAVNATNGNGSTSGDQVVTASTSVTTLGLSDFKRIAFAVYPNPSTDYVKFSLNDAFLDKAEVTITNIQGQVVKRQNISSNFNRIEVADLSNGVYFIQLTSGNKLGFSKFIKN